MVIVGWNHYIIYSGIEKDLQVGQKEKNTGKNSFFLDMIHRLQFQLLHKPWGGNNGECILRQRENWRFNPDFEAIPPASFGWMCQ